MVRQGGANADPGLTASLQQAVALFSAGQLDRALTAFESILKRYPGQPEALHGLGIIALQQNRLDDAARFLDAAVAAKPEEVDWAKHRLHARERLASAYAMVAGEAVAAYRRIAVPTRTAKHADQLRYEVVGRAGTPERFAEICSRPEFSGVFPSPLHGRFARALHARSPWPGYRDLSFALLDAGAPVLFVTADILVNPRIVATHLVNPIRLNFATSYRGSREAAVKATLHHLNRLASANGAVEIHLAASSPVDRLDLVDEIMLNRGGRPQVRLRAWVDLAMEEERYWPLVRKSYRPLIRAAMRTCRMAYCGPGAFDGDVFADYVALAGKARGEATRESEASVIAEFIKAGEAEISVMSAEGQGPIAATLVVDEGGQSTYWSGHYPAKGVAASAHWPVYDSILRSRQRGNIRYHLGDMTPLGELSPYGEYSLKYSDISLFKRGLATEIKTQLHWALPTL